MYRPYGSKEGGWIVRLSSGGSRLKGRKELLLLYYGLQYVLRINNLLCFERVEWGDFGGRGGEFAPGGIVYCLFGSWKCQWGKCTEHNSVVIEASVHTLPSFFLPHPSRFDMCPWV